MTVSIYTLNPAAPIWEFDITTEVSKELKWNPTTRPVENVGKVADHVYKVPFTIKSDGAVAITPISPRTYRPIPTDDPSVLITMQKALEDLAAKEDLVTLSSDIYTGPAVIKSLRFAKTVAGGHSLRAAVGFSEIEIAVPQTTQVNPSRLKAKVKRRISWLGGQKATPQNGKGADALKNKAKSKLLRLLEKAL